MSSRGKERGLKFREWKHISLGLVGLSLLFLAVIVVVVCFCSCFRRVGGGRVEGQEWGGYVGLGVVRDCDLRNCVCWFMSLGDFGAWKWVKGRPRERCWFYSLGQPPTSWLWAGRSRDVGLIPWDQHLGFVCGDGSFHLIFSSFEYFKFLLPMLELQLLAQNISLLSIAFIASSLMR